MKSDRDLVLISVFTALTVVLWVFFELVKTSKTTTISPTVSRIVAPFSPKLDTSILPELEKRKTY